MVPATPNLDSTTLGRFIRQLLLVSQQQVVHIAPTYLKKLPERWGGGKFLKKIGGILFPPNGSEVEKDVLELPYMLYIYIYINIDLHI